MTITRTSINLTDLQWWNKKHPRGPELKFSITWRGITETDHEPAWTVPGFKLVKNSDGEIVLRAPLARRGSSMWHTCQISVDLANWIIETLKTTKAYKRIGQNHKPERILDIPDELVPELPEEMELY